MDTIASPFGPVNRTLVPRLSLIAGLEWDTKNQDWRILTDLVNYWHLNKSEERKANEAKWYRKIDPLPIRYYNFQYAIAKTKTIEAAIDYAEKKLFGLDGKPLYLPDEFSIKNGLSTEKMNYSYSKILREVVNLNF